MAADDGPSLEGNDIAALDIADAPAPEPPRKFKVVSDGFSATISLDTAWQAKPFLQGVVKPLVLKLNKRKDAEPVAAELLERVEVDGVDVVLGFITKSRTAAEVVPKGAEKVELFFGMAPPPELKFKVKSSGIEFTITLDAKFMRKTFYDAVVVPFVTMYNRRTHIPVEAGKIVQVHIDGSKKSGAMGKELNKTALTFLGRHPGLVELFFSWEAVEQASKKASTEYSRLGFKVAIQNAGEFQKQGELEYDHCELNAADGVELGRKMNEFGPLKKLKCAVQGYPSNTPLLPLLPLPPRHCLSCLSSLPHATRASAPPLLGRYIFLAHNALSDAGIAGLALALTRTNTPILKKLHLSHNRITNAGVKAFSEVFDAKSHVSPDLQQLDFEDNYIGDEGCDALAAAIGSGNLIAKELWLHGNTAVTPTKRGALKAQLGDPAAPHKSIVLFDPVSTGSPFHEDGTISSATGGRI